MFLAFLIYFFAAVDFFVNYGVEFYPPGVIFILIALSITAFAITKTELMDIRVVIGRSLAYGIVAVLLMASFIGLNLIKMPAILIIILNTLLALFWAWMAHRLRELIQTPLEEKWIVGFYDANKLMNSITRKLVSALEKEDVFKVIVEELKANIKIKKIGIVMGKPETDYRDVTPTKQGLVIPLSSSNGIDGIIILGQKISEDPYDSKDFTFFRTVMHQATLALDRIRPYEEVKREYEVTRKAMEKAQQVITLGALALQTEHEIQNPMAAIDLHAGLLLEHRKDKEHIEERIEKFVALVKRNTQRIGEITSRMREFGAPKKREKILTDINELLSNKVLFLLEGHLKQKRIKVQKELGETPKIIIDPIALEQVFINIALNAIQAMKEDGILTITTYQAKHKIREKTIDSVIVKIKDTGEGIPKENLEKVFLPMFTTRYEGVGLGLSISYRIIIEEHQGDISIESEIGKGTEVTVALPLQ